MLKQSRLTLRAVGLVLAVVGALLLKNGVNDRSSPESWQWHEAPLAGIALMTTQKSGLRSELQLEGVDERFAYNFVERIAGLENRLRAARVPGAAVRLAVMPRTTGGWNPATPEPLPVLELWLDGERLVPPPGGDGFDPLALVILLIGGLVGLAGLALLGLSWRPARD